MKENIPQQMNEDNTILRPYKTHFPNADLMIEGVTIKQDGAFEFNFSQDGVRDILSLSHDGLYASTVFKNTFYFGYQFNEGVESATRTAFLKAIKFDTKTIESRDLDRFLMNAVNKLDDLVNVAHFHALVIPQSKSEMNRRLAIEMTKRAESKLVFFELIKKLPQDIEFDYEKFRDLELSKPAYRDKDDVLRAVEEMMAEIKSLDYFSIARNVRGSGLRKYIQNFFMFKTPEEEAAYRRLQSSDILIIDDIVTSGTTLNHIIKTLRVLNESNRIVVFSLIGKEIADIDTM